MFTKISLRKMKFEEFILEFSTFSQALCVFMYSLYLSFSWRGEYSSFALGIQFANCTE